MADRKDAASPAPHDEGADNSSARLAELDGLRARKDPEKRAARAWEIIVHAAGVGDFPVLFDFALEHGLIRSCEEGPSSRIATWVNPLDGSEMVWIPAGPFFVGPQKERAECRGFSLARFPVTNAQFAAFVDGTGYTPPAGHPEPELFLSHWAEGRPPRGKEDHPVVWVSFLDALHYCRWAGLTLPTEWQWEKAARGPDGRPFPWGDAPPHRFPGLANVLSDDTDPVGAHSRVRTAYGCEDLVGNVSEWCQMTQGDDFGSVPDSFPDDQPPADGEIVHAAVRGSAFMRSDPRRMAAWHRRKLAVTRRNFWVGFRPALFLACRPAE